MERFIKPDPIELPRTYKMVDGVLESVVTAEGNVMNQEHLRREKENWVNAHLVEVAQKATFFEQERMDMAAD